MNDLVDAIRRGDAGAFEALVSRYGGQVYRVAFRFFQSRADAEEIVQEVFARAYRELARFRGDAQLGTWLYRIAVNACLDEKRRVRTRQEVPLEAAAEAVTPDADPLVRAASRQFADRVRAAIEALPPKQRVVLILKIYEELLLPEIAEIMVSPLGTVKANYHHALVRVRQAVRDLIEPAEGRDR